MPGRIVVLHRWQVVISFAAVTAAYIVGLLVTTHLNNQRVNDLQKSRVESCQQTYEGVRQVFKPFFRPEKIRTAKERRDIKKFNRTVDRLKAGCRQQIQPF